MAVEVHPIPSDDELAAILSAYEVLWPQAAAQVRPEPSPRWRFAGRSWTPRARYGGWR